MPTEILVPLKKPYISLSVCFCKNRRVSCTRNYRHVYEKKILPSTKEKCTIADGLHFVNPAELCIDSY
jgi:hypothetical protein